MRFLNDSHPPYELTYSDVFMVPSHSEVGSRQSVDLTTEDGTGNTIPLIVANMTAVAGRRMAETIARRGGLTILPQDLSLEAAAETIASVKAADLVYDTPITVKPHHTVGYTSNLLHKRAHGAAIVVEGDMPIGIITPKDLRRQDNFTAVGQLMTTDLVRCRWALTHRRLLPSCAKPPASWRQWSTRMAPWPESSRGRAR